jgi:hypothetical protein
MEKNRDIRDEVATQGQNAVPVPSATESNIERAQPHQVHWQLPQQWAFHSHVSGSVPSETTSLQPHTVHHHPPAQHAFHSHVSAFVGWMADKTSGPMTFRLISSLLPAEAQPVKLELCTNGQIMIATGGAGGRRIHHCPGRWSSPKITILRISCAIHWWTAPDDKGVRSIRSEHFEDELMLLSCTQVFVSTLRGYAFMLAPLVDEVIGSCKVWEQSQMYMDIHQPDDVRDFVAKPSDWRRCSHDQI